IDSKRRSRRAPGSSQAPCTSQLVLTVQNAEPQDANAWAGNDSASAMALKSGSGFMVSPAWLVEHPPQGKRRCTRAVEIEYRVRITSSTAGAMRSAAAP